jgi:hypothetical protein
MSAELHEFRAQEVMAYLDGEVSGERGLVLAKHLENCAECPSVAEDFCNLSQQLSAWRIQPPALMEPSVQSDAEVLVSQKADLEARMVGSECPHGIPPPAASLTVASFTRRPWVWALGGACAMMLVVSIGNKMRAPRASVPATMSAHLDQRNGEGEKGPPSGKLPAAGLNMRGARGPSNLLRLDGDQVTGSSTSGAGTNASRGERSADSSKSSYTANIPVNGRNYINFTLTESRAATAAVPATQMIEKTASLSLTVKDLDAVRSAVEGVLKQHNGFFAELNTTGTSDAGRSLTASLRVPASELDATLAELRKQGRIEDEKQGGEEVSQQYVDLNARLDNARQTEKRLTELLTKRTAKLKDVLDVEREIAESREEIERMEAQQRNTNNLVHYASIDLRVREEYMPTLKLTPPAAATRMRNAVVDGYQSVLEIALGLLLFLLADGPSILFWFLLLFFPARWAWRKLRLNSSPKQSLVGAV